MRAKNHLIRADGLVLQGKYPVSRQPDVVERGSRDEWIRSVEQTHEPLITEDTFTQAQRIFAAGSRGSGPRTRTATRNRYLLRGCVYCGVCDRKMQGEQSHGASYYRCRFPQEYALVLQPQFVSRVA
jgi:site-specific DNA recombinase